MKCLVCFILVFSLSVAQDCPLPANADIWNALATLLLDADGSQSYSPKITGSVQYVCQAQGNMINTYTEISLIATYTPNPGEAETTRILSMGCSSGTWSGITQDGLSPPPASVIGVSLRTNCFQCREGFSRETRCRECDSACNSGLMRCTGSGSGDCCLSFAANGQCSNDLSCLSSGPNYVATESTNFTCTCNLTCSVGYSVNSNCTDCYLASICDADSPCMNGGQCIQYSPPDNYTCNCTGTGFQGVNCTVSDLVTDGSCPANISFLFVIRDLTINVPLTEPVCIRCRFFSNQGVFISFSDGIWRKGSTVLSDGDFSGNVIISSTSTTLFLTLVHPATVVDVGDTLTCSSSSADQNSIVTIGAFNFLNPRVSPNGTVSVIEGSNLTLTCSDPGNSGTPRYVWINDSDGSELTPVINNPPLTLHLTNINRAASGNYICRSTSIDVPGVNMDTTVTLNVQYLYIISASLNQTVAIGTNYSINCSFDAFPMIESVIWFHNRTAINLEAFPHISISTEATTSELSLLPIGGLDDGGEYSCSVSNGVLNASDSLLNLTVVFLLKPDPVYNLMTSNITNTSVTLSWSLGFNGDSPITGGIVSYAAVSNGFGNGTEVFMGENEELIIFNLQPFTVYNFSVAVENAIGSSNDVTIVAETQPNVPDAPTLNSVVIISSNSLKVNWTNNVDPLTQSEVEWYTVMYFTEGQHNELNVPAPANTVIINDLLEGTSYSIVVSATNSAGIGASGNSITIQTVTNTPPVIEASDTFMITVGEKALYTLRITDPGDTISVTIEFDEEFPYTLDQDGSIWTLNVTLSSLVEFNFTVIATDSLNATSKITPQVIICSCTSNRGNCTINEYESNTSNPLILTCDCMKAYEGEYCKDDFDGCTEVSCFNGATCTDVPAPGTGATCPPCPSGYTGDGIICHIPPGTLPYIVFNSSISTVTNITRHYLYSSCRVNVPRPITLLGSAFSSIYISIGGTFSISGRFNYFFPTLFPSSIRGIRDSVMFAPMWNFYDIRREGSVSYQTFSSDNPLANDVFNDVNSFIRTSKNITSYKGMWMLVMEWKDVHPYPHGSYYYYYYYYYNQILEKHNTFQAILTTDGSDTHIIYTYKCGDIMWDNYYSRSVVGYNIARGRYENHRGSGIPGELLKLGCYDDMNKAAKYTNIVYSFQSDKKDPNVAICLERYRNDLELSAISSSFAIPCPCSAWQVWFDRRFRFTYYHDSDIQHVECYSNRFSQLYQSMCCYSFTFPSWGALLVNGPYSSHVFRYNPFFNYLNYAKYDEEFYSKCCTRTQNCELFRERRPIKTCAGYIPPRRTWFWGDPHINTLDGATYTFNGLGEYVLLRTINADFEIQARTKLTTPNTTATVFSAVALTSDKDRTEVVEIQADGNNQNFIILYNGNDVSANLSTVNDTLDYNTVSLARETQDVISVALSSGVSLNATLRLGILSFTMVVPETYMTETMGLQGNFDGDKTNDFVNREGNMVPYNSSDADIYHNFGQTWQVQSDQESLFTYAPERTYASYSNPNHVPVFLDQIDPETRAEAERICGGSNKIECIFDYSQTKNEELALDTQTTMEQNELNKQIGNNLPPVIEASDTFMLTVGETALYTTNITDPGDTISVTFDGEFPYTLDQDGSIWTLNVTHFSLVEFSFTVIASDSFNATSVLTPQVRICGCPADRGSCTVEGVQNASSNPLILICNCIEAYNGKYCEDDYDGCTEVSCFNDATCTDVPAPGTGATCPPCPSGYTGDGLICDDIDECNSTSTSNCSHFCNNTIGSYQCTCMPGYELHSDGRSCNEINECEKLLDNCQQECMNTDGSFSCSCYDGFLLQDDGRSCQNDPNRECLDHSMCEQFCVYDNYTKTKNCSCQSGYDLSTNMANCTDIDECSETNPCTQICINTIGSFECNCSDGFQLQSDGFTCTDIDECLVLGSCPEPRIRCVNSPGSFDCFCPLGTIFQDGSCKVLVEPVPSLSASSKSSAYSSTVNSSPVMSTYFGSFTNSPSSLLAVSSPSVTPTPTLPENSGVIVVLSGTNKSNFDIESFKNVTAEALNDYCITNDCTSVSSEKRKRVAVNNLIEANDIVITEITETINGLRVKFYIKGQSGAPFDANAVVAALKAADSKYSSAGFTIAGVTILNSHSSTIVVTTTASVTPIPVVQIIGITIVVVIGILIIMIIIISILWFIRQSDKKKSQGDSSGVILEKELNKEDKETIL